MGMIFELLMEPGHFLVAQEHFEWLMRWDPPFFWLLNKNIISILDGAKKSPATPNMEIRRWKLVLFSDTKML